ncbi:methyltransferase family protein [Prauserella shujinwangii]|uniref:Methyltransferase family protein n=1 Tax=Prauserella shujinwangii TaxID=1453103 RepID=A0A2T0LYW9_9PSEU|nr:methyltransferase family protein [Prauserella shujinwangii]
MRRIVAACPGRAGAVDVVDVGCGTGIAARQFTSAGCAVLGVEPDPRMAEVARRHGIRIERARFEEWDPAGRTFDAVVSGQTWHWIDPVAGAAKAAEVLRPGGVLAALWHALQPPPEVTEAFATTYRRLRPDAPFDPGATAQGADAYQAILTKAADGLRSAGVFGTPRRWWSGWERSYTRDEWLDQLPTHGSLTGFSPDELAEVLAAVGSAVDARGGRVPVRYTTVALVATRSRAVRLAVSGRGRGCRGRAR